MIGSTVSAIGGLLKAIERASEYGYNCTQIYTSKSRSWDVSYCASSDAEKIIEYSKEKNVTLVAHVPFLVNLSSPDESIRQKSVERLKFEVINSSILGIKKLILHPGSAVNDIRLNAIENIILGLNSVAELCSTHTITILLETMSGQGTQIGSTFEELNYILSKSKCSEYLGVCLDTSHVFASGYDISNVMKLDEVLIKFDSCIGFEKIGCFHLNNTMIPCGNKTDRHSSIFNGKILLEVFEDLVNNPHFINVSKILEPTITDLSGQIQVKYLKNMKRGNALIIDKLVDDYFNNNVKQVFVYLTNRCQLHCRQCLYKPFLNNHSDDINFNVLINMLRKFKEYGAFKLSFLGGEPTLYKDKITGATFSEIVEAAKGLGYDYVRVDTNGQFDSDFLTRGSKNEDSNSKKVIKKIMLDEITFSIDGYDAETHDAIRGKGVFDKCIANIKLAVKAGYKVQITSCFHKELCKSVNNGIESIQKIISLCEELGVTTLNLHPILKVGVERDNWIDNTNINPRLWLDIYNGIQKRLFKKQSNVNIRLPMRYIEKDSFNESCNYCPLKIGERALIMSDGTIKICAFNIGTNYCLARFDENSIKYEWDYNELDKISDSTICCNQSSTDGLKALCMSYKPQQDEIVWNSFREEL